ncbi:MAG: deoxyribonuclease V [candidate division WOR-3 bacterium]
MNRKIDFRSLIQEQKRLARLVSLKRIDKGIRFIGGADVGFDNNGGVGVIVVVEYGTLKMVDLAWAKGKITIPYIPTLLGFREVSLLIDAYQCLTIKPDVILVDGQGIAHPRRLGLASHLGVMLDISTIGCAKSCLIGRYEELNEEKGEISPLLFSNELIGYAVRTRHRVRPVFVSPGNKVDFSQSVEMVIRSVDKYRIPEPLRQAHILAKSLTNRQLRRNC